MSMMSERDLILSGLAGSSAGDASSLFSKRAIIREARDDVSRPGKYQGRDAWVAWLHGSDWASCADYEVGSVDEYGWCGLWTLDHADLGSDHRLFRDLRDEAVTCVCLVETGDGFVYGSLHTEPVATVERQLDRYYGPRCDACGASLADGWLEVGDESFCFDCAVECDGCGDAFMLADAGACGRVCEVDSDTGTLGFVCNDCDHGELDYCEPGSREASHV